MKFRIAILLAALCLFYFGCKDEVTIYRLGALLPLSGEAEGYGQQVKNGLMLAMNEINDSGGIQGKKIDIFFDDDGTSEEKAVQKANTMIKSTHVPLIIGGITSNVALALAPICEQNKVVLLSP